MAFRYTSTENGQIVDSEVRLDYLEGLARWQVSEMAEIPESELAANVEAEAKAETEATVEPAAPATPKARTRK